MSSVELVIYMPILLLIILLAVQFTWTFFGNQAASAVARETARHARVYDDPAGARQVGLNYARNIGKGVLSDVNVTVQRVGDDRIRVTVTGRSQEVAPIGVADVRQTVEGPIEEFQTE